MSARLGWLLSFNARIGGGFNDVLEPRSMQREHKEAKSLGFLSRCQDAKNPTLGPKDTTSDDYLQKHTRNKRKKSDIQ